LSIAGVCRKWRGIVLGLDADKEFILWGSILVEATNITWSQVPGSLKPRGNGQPDNLRKIIIATRIAKNHNRDYQFLLRWLARFDLTNFGLIHNNAAASSTMEILRTVSNKGLLQSISIVGRDEESMECLKLDRNVFARLQSLQLVDLDIDPSTLNFRMEELESLRIHHTKSPPLHGRMTSLQIYAIVSNCPSIKEFEIELGFEDTPAFTSVQFPLPRNALSHLRVLKTRYSYFQNRLIFLRHLPLVSLRTVILSIIPSCTDPLSWSPLETLLKLNDLGRRIRHVEVLDVLPRSKGTFDAGYITSQLPDLQTLSLHNLAVSHFIQYLTRTLKEREFPLAKIQKIDLWNSMISDSMLIDLVSAYCETMSQPPREETAGGTTSGGVGSFPLKSIDLYKCPGVTLTTMNKISYMLREPAVPCWEALGSKAPANHTIGQSNNFAPVS